MCQKPTRFGEPNARVSREPPRPGWHFWRTWNMKYISPKNNLSPLKKRWLEQSCFLVGFYSGWKTIFLYKNPTFKKKCTIATHSALFATHSCHFLAKQPKLYYPYSTTRLLIPKCCMYWNICHVFTINLNPKNVGEFSSPMESSGGNPHAEFPRRNPPFPSASLS